MCALARDPERLKGEEGKEEGAVEPGGPMGPAGLRGEEAKLLIEEMVVLWERGLRFPLLDELEWRSASGALESEGELDEEASWIRGPRVKDDWCFAGRRMVGGGSSGCGSEVEKSLRVEDNWSIASPSWWVDGKRAASDSTSTS
jgi:hypothetical protein